MRLSPKESICCHRKDFKIAMDIKRTPQKRRCESKAFVFYSYDSLPHKAITCSFISYKTACTILV